MKLPTKEQITEAIALVERRQEIYVEQHKNNAAITEAMDHFETGRYLIPGTDTLAVVNVGHTDPIRIVKIIVIDDQDDTVVDLKGAT